MNEPTLRPFVLGAILTDEWAASPNMGDSQDTGSSKTAMMKTINTAEGQRTLISGQSIGSWHRQTLYSHFGWDISELQETISSSDSRQFYTKCQPIKFEEDDGRGYMAAVSLKKDKTTVPLTTKRTSPFMLSQFQSVAPVRPVTEFGIFSQKFGRIYGCKQGQLDFPNSNRGGVLRRNVRSQLF